MLNRRGMLNKGKGDVKKKGDAKGKGDEGSTLQCPPPFLQESTGMGPVKSSILATVLVEYGRTWNPVGIWHSSSI